MFTRKVDGNLASLAKALDKAIAKNQDKQLCGFVVLLTDDGDAAEKKLASFAAKHGLEHLPLTYIEGPPPASYNIAKDAEVTVILWKAVRVVKSRGFTSTKDLKKTVVQSIVRDAVGMLD